MLPDRSARGDEERHLCVIGTEAKGTWDSVVHLHPVDEFEHVPTLRSGDRHLVLTEHVRDLLQREAQFPGVDEL